MLDDSILLLEVKPVCDVFAVVRPEDGLWEKVVNFDKLDFSFEVDTATEVRFRYPDADA